MSERSIDNLRPGADVFGADGEKLGTLHAVIVDPAARHVTHLAVNAGPHFPAPGFGDPKIVSVGIEHYRDAHEDRVELNLTRAQFGALPLYEHTHFFEIPADEQTRDTEGVSRWAHIGSAIAAALGSLTGLAVPAEHIRKAAFERQILDDAPVWREDPNTHIGDVERVLIDDQTGEIESLVIRRGVLFQHEVVLPIRFVTEIRDGVIRAQLTDAELENLEPFEP